MRTTASSTLGRGLAAIGLIIGCAGPGPGDEPDPEGEVGLVGVVWEWRELQGSDDSTIDVADPSLYTLEFRADGSYSVRADCNRGSGSYELDGSRLTLGAGPMTMAACPPESHSDRFVRDLGYVRSFVFDGGDLYLSLFADGGILRFSAPVD